MARNKVINLVRDNQKEKLARQAHSARQPLDQLPERPTMTDVGVDYQDLLQKSQTLLLPEEARLVEERLAGRS